MSLLPNKNIFDRTGEGGVTDLIVQNLTIQGMTAGSLLYIEDNNGDVGGIPIGPTGYILNSNGVDPFWENGFNLNDGVANFTSGSYLNFLGSYMMLDSSSSLLGQNGSIINGDTIEANTFQYKSFPTVSGILKVVNNIFTLDTEKVTQYNAGSLSLPTTNTILYSFPCYMSLARNYSVTVSFQYTFAGSSTNPYFSVNVASTPIINISSPPYTLYQTATTVYNNPSASGTQTISFYGYVNGSGTATISNVQFIVTPL